MGRQLTAFQMLSMVEAQQGVCAALCEGDMVIREYLGWGKCCSYPRQQIQSGGKMNISYGKNLISCTQQILNYQDK